MEQASSASDVKDDAQPLLLAPQDSAAMELGTANAVQQETPADSSVACVRLARKLGIIFIAVVALVGLVVRP
jgi:hypothetical protein